eukprot:3647071-Alexandrium_andersonii.AAC.1
MSPLRRLPGSECPRDLPRVGQLTTRAFSPRKPSPPVLKPDCAVPAFVPARASSPADIDPFG